MIISTITQLGLRLRADPEKIPFQYSANIQMKFIKDENYNDYTVIGYYIPPGENEAKLLNINDDGTFTLGPDCFKNRGTLSFSFNLVNSIEEVHLGSIDFEVRYAFGDGDTILPEPEEVWISLVTQVAKDAIKEDVELVKQKANEALQSASLANDKASEAEEYANNANQSAGSASLSASSALTAKNDAIAASNSAIQAKQDAEQSANNAKNSANTALENANKSTVAIETVTQIKTEIENKANDFDTNYQEKLKSFNDNATSKQSAFDNSVQTANTNLDNKVNQANSDLDVKVQEANTIIDEKVKTATEQAQKATDEANRAEQATDGKLDKNLGVENAGKSLVVGENGEVVCGESGINEDEVNKIIDKAIDEKLYTQEEVDYMLADKMDKPYVPIEITDNATITDALDGNFKIDKIKGNTYQKVETDIVPTPNRPVPINSRKTLVTKANPNIFNLEKESDTSNIPDSGTYRSVGQYQLKANTKYIFEWSEATVPAKATLSFQIQDDKGTVLVSPFTYFNLKTTEKKETGKQVEFTTNSSGIVKFAYNCTVGTSNTIETYQQYWYTKILKDITLKEDVEYEPEYIELRSLKETINKFDLGLLSQTDLISGNGAYRKIEIPIKLKPNTRYKIYYEKSMIPALTWTVLNIVDNAEKILTAILNVKNTENNEVEKQAINSAFTSPIDGEIYFSYFVQSFNAEGVQVPQNTEIFKEKWFTKILKNIMITEESLNQNIYVAPTVRDYKIVDHVNKTAKIIRNVRQRLLTAKDGFYKSGYGGMEISLKDAKPLKKNETTTSFCNLFNHNISDTIPNNLCYRLASNYLQFNYEGYNEKTLWDKFITDNELYIQYQLATPVEETITYVETDVSEVGYSWQDTTSPSPTIKSEVKPVEKIDILKTGKNIFDLEKAKDRSSWVPSIIQVGYNDFMIKVIKGKQYTFSYDGTLNMGIGFYAGIVINQKDITNSYISKWFYHSDLNNLIINKHTFLATEDYVSLRINTRGIDTALEYLKKLQLELGDTATAYEPYTGQRVNYTPTNPMFSTQDGSIADYVDVKKGVEVYNMSGAVVLDGSDDEGWQYALLAEVPYVGISLTNILSSAAMKEIWCDKIECYQGSIVSSVGTKIIYEKNIFITRPNASNLQEWREWLSQNPITVVYQIATPTEIPIPEEDLAKIKSLKTNTGVNNIFVGGEIKPSIEARYPRDVVLAVNRLQNKLLTLQEEVVKNV